MKHGIFYLLEGYQGCLYSIDYELEKIIPYFKKTIC